MSNPQPIQQPPLRPVGIAPIEKFFLFLGFAVAIAVGFIWRDAVLVLLTVITTFALTTLFVAWRVASYIIGLLADLAPAFRRLKQVGLLG